MSNLKICDTQMTAAIPVIRLSLFRYELGTFLLILLSLLFFIPSASHLWQLPLADPPWRRAPCPFHNSVCWKTNGCKSDATLPGMTGRSARHTCRSHNESTSHQSATTVAFKPSTICEQRLRRQYFTPSRFPPVPAAMLELWTAEGDECRDSEGFTAFPLLQFSTGWH